MIFDFIRLGRECCRNANAQTSVLHKQLDIAYEQFLKEEALDKDGIKRRIDELKNEVVKIGNAINNYIAEKDLEEVEIIRINSDIQNTQDQINKLEEEDVEPPLSVYLLLVIGAFITICLTLFLFVFYSSTAYSTYFGISCKQQGLLDLDVFSKASNKGGLVLTLIILFPMIFLGLGFLIHDALKKKKFLIISLMLIVTLLVDFIIGYKLSQELYQCRYDEDPNLLPWNFSMIFNESNFYLVLASGFAAYILWGALLEYTLNKLEEIEPDQRNQIWKEQLQNELVLLNSNLDNCKKKVNEIDAKIESNRQNIELLQKQINAFENGGVIPIDIPKLKAKIGMFMQGWVAYIELMHPETDGNLTNEAMNVSENWLKQINQKTQSLNNLWQKDEKKLKNSISIAGLYNFFGVFVYVITRPSILSIALKELETSYTKEEIKAVWDKYKAELSTENEFLYNIREKLSVICKTKSEMNSCKLWLPKAPESLNLIIIPDLSNRLTKIPKQKENDVEILNYIWNKFKKISISKRQSNDVLSVDLSDYNQLQGFQGFADNLVFDLSKEKKEKKVTKDFFESKGNQFSENIDRLYKMVNTTHGADFVAYFKNHAKSNLKQSDFFNEYRNIIIILTDGYLETSNPFYAYTGTGSLQSLVCNDLKSGLNLNQSFEKQKIPSIASRIPTSIDLSDAEVLILEINERQGGEKCHYDILKKFWKDWFKSMKIKNADDDFFLMHEDATKKTINKLDDFFNKKISIIDDTKEPDTHEVSGSSSLTNSNTLSKGYFNNTENLSNSNNTKEDNKKNPVCNPQVVSDYYKEDIKRLINVKESIKTRLVLLKKENKQINLSNFQSRLKQGEFRNRNVYHVGVNPNCEIISIEIE